MSMVLVVQQYSAPVSSLTVNIILCWTHVKQMCWEIFTSSIAGRFFLIFLKKFNFGLESDFPKNRQLGSRIPKLLESWIHTCSLKLKQIFIGQSLNNTIHGDWNRTLFSVYLEFDKCHYSTLETCSSTDKLSFGLQIKWPLILFINVFYSALRQQLNALKEYEKIQMT